MIYTITLNPSLDYTVTVPEFEIGKINRSSSEKIEAGGKGINVSKVLKELGIKKAEDYYTVEFNLGDKIITKSVKSGEKVTVPTVTSTYFQGWYYLVKSGTEDNPTYTEAPFNQQNINIEDDYYIYAKSRRHFGSTQQHTHYNYFRKPNVYPKALCNYRL